MTAINLIHDPVAFIDQFIRLNEKGKPWTLSPHQRRVLNTALQWDAQGRLSVRTFLWGEMKKSGKTFVAACLALWWAFVTSHTEIIIAANDLEQSVGRVFHTIAKLLEHNPALGLSAKVRASDIALTNGTTITAIASDYKGAAGSRHSLVVFDELWGYSLEAAQRLYEELTPPPTEDHAWALIVTYAGWTGESVLLERLYKQGLAGARIDEELELYQAGDLCMFWSHTARQPWQTERYYTSQRAILRPSTFARLHENRWISSESTFITPELWDACVDAEHRPLLPSRHEDEFVAVDIGLKSDNAAVVRVRRRKNQIILAGYRLWKPTQREPLNLEETVEAYLREIRTQYIVRRILIDPWQAARSIQTLKAAGLPIEEFPQTVSNTTRMAQTLYDLLKGKNLTLFIDDELRQQAMNTVAIETPRGFRIAKEKASRKIDAVVALSMACVAAVDAGTGSPFDITGGGSRGSADDDDEAEVVSVTHGGQQVDEPVLAQMKNFYLGRW